MRMKIYAPNLTVSLKRILKCSCSFAFALHYKYYRQHETGPSGVAAGLQACGWEAGTQL